LRAIGRTVIHSRPAPGAARNPSRRIRRRGDRHAVWPPRQRFEVSAWPLPPFPIAARIGL
jgi:hypothetical protein